MNDNLDMLGPSTRILKDESSVIERDMTYPQFKEEENENKFGNNNIDKLKEHINKYHNIHQRLVIDKVEINQDDIDFQNQLFGFIRIKNLGGLQKYLKTVPNELAIKIPIYFDYMD